MKRIIKSLSGCPLNRLYTRHKIIINAIFFTYLLQPLCARRALRIQQRKKRRKINFYQKRFSVVFIFRREFFFFFRVRKRRMHTMNMHVMCVSLVRTHLGSTLAGDTLACFRLRRRWHINPIRTLSGSRTHTFLQESIAPSVKFFSFQFNNHCDASSIVQ